MIEVLSALLNRGTAREAVLSYRVTSTGNLAGSGPDRSHEALCCCLAWRAHVSLKAVILTALVGVLGWAGRRVMG